MLIPSDSGVVGYITCMHTDDVPSHKIAPSYGVSKVLIAVPDPHLALGGLFVVSCKFEGEDPNNENVGRRANHASHDSKRVLWFVLLSKDQTPSNASNASKPNQCGTAKRSLPLPSDVVRLIGHDGGYVGINARSNEKQGKVSDSGAC